MATTLGVQDGLTDIPRAALLDLISGLAQIDAVIWIGEPEPTLGADGSYATLSIKGYVSKGVDETRQEYDQPNDQILESTNGIRLFTLTVDVISFSFDTPAYATLENIRRRIRGYAAKTLMQQEGLAFVKFPGPIVELDYITDNREAFRSALDMRFAFAVSEVDSTATGDYIASTGQTPQVPGTVTP